MSSLEEDEIIEITTLLKENIAPQPESNASKDNLKSNSK
jgi:hypothetical protein